MTKFFMDRLEDRRHLLQVPEDVSFATISKHEDVYLEFSSTYEENLYIKMVGILGHDIAVSIGIPQSSISADASKKHTYLSTVKYSTVHVASCSFGEKDLLLSEDAIGDLKELSMIHKAQGTNMSADVQQLCEEFFRTYGSHANRGPLSFGGNFWWTCSSRDFRVEKCQEDAICWYDICWLQ